MKKLFTLASLLLVLALNANAQWRKTWDFSKGLSEETKANLNADPNWNANRKDAETGVTTGWKDAVKMSGTLQANGVDIAELKGLVFGTAGLSNGSNFLLDPTTIRMSRDKMEVSLPKLAAGQKITMVAKSANATATNRGFKGSDNLEYIDGPANGICLGSEGFQTLVWQVKADVEDSVEVKLIAVKGGLDIQSIIIDDGDAPDVEEAKQVAYVADAATIEEDFAYIFLGGTDGVTLTAIDPAVAISLDSLQTYDVVVVAPSVKADDALAPVLKSAVAYQPVLSMNATLAEAWGYAKPVATSETSVTVAENAAENGLFTDMDVTALELLTEGGLKGVELGEYFADDDVLATAGEAVAIHQHNASRNSYLYLPFDAENLVLANQDILPQLLANAIAVLAKSKKDVVATGTPAITQQFKNQVTEVSIVVSSKSAQVYYTLDGTEPTDASTLYTEAFTLTEPATVKAIAYADGYLPSKVASLDVIIKSQAAAPVITTVNNADNTEITLTTETEGVDIYYSYNGIEDPAFAQKYTEPIVLSQEPGTIYAFAAGGDYVQSELSSKAFSINSLNAQTIRLDTLAHFDANQTDWLVDNTELGGTGSASAYYYWGKSAWNYYSTEIDHEETVKDSEGNDSIVYYYKPNPEAVRVVNPNTENGWIMRSAGQVLTGELTLGIEAKVGNGATGRYAVTAEDMLGGAPSKGAITFGTKVSGEPYTASIETTGKYAAPFDVIVYVGNGNGSGKATMEVQVSADGMTWESVGEALTLSDTQRYYKKNRVGVETAGEYYVRLAQTGGGTKAQVYDIYILNNGEISQAYDPTSGIESVNGNAETLRSEVYNVNGMRVNGLQKGLNIVRKHLANGSVKTVKVMVK